VTTLKSSDESAMNLGKECVISLENRRETFLGFGSPILCNVGWARVPAPSLPYTRHRRYVYVSLQNATFSSGQCWIRTSDLRRAKAALRLLSFPLASVTPTHSVHFPPFAKEPRDAAKPRMWIFLSIYSTYAVLYTGEQLQSVHSEVHGVPPGDC
jgi:hypothetical protein